MPAPTTKLCYDCDHVLPYSAFHRNAASKDGYAAYCKQCMAARRLGLHAPRLHRGKVRVQERIASDRKLCPRCQTVKSLTQDFYQNKHCADGHCALCKPCHIKNNKRTANPEHAKHYAAEYRARLRQQQQQQRDGPDPLTPA